MSDRDVNAEQIVKRYSMFAAGAGLIPMPLVDVAAISVLQYNMVREIAAAYDVPFDGQRTRSLIGALIGGTTSTSIGYGIGKTYLKAIPIVGPLVASVAMPGSAAAFTWAVGKVFMQHFSLGGTLLDFKPEETRASVDAHAAAHASA